MEKSEYRMIYTEGTGEIVEKKSRFIANVYYVDSEEQVTSYINTIKKKYWDARHHCHAYVIGNHNELQRCSDDGEPSGTAGKPILEVILGDKIHNCLIIVTRYFGGTLLGTGGLVRAYQEAAKQAIEASVLADRVDGNCITIQTDYNGLGKIQYIVKQMQILIEDIQYTDAVVMNILLSQDCLVEFISKVTEATAARAVIVEITEKYIVKPRLNVNK